MVNITFNTSRGSDWQSAKCGRAPRVGLRGGRRVRHSSVDRFWARVQKSDGCWVFTGAVCNRAGHLHIAREDGSRALAHRFSYELHHGLIPTGLVVMHSCDVPACVNPAHLSLGTQRENVHDAMRKGRRRVSQRLLQAPPAHPEQPQGHRDGAHFLNHAWQSAPVLVGWER